MLFHGLFGYYPHFVQIFIILFEYRDRVTYRVAVYLDHVGTCQLSDIKFLISWRENLIVVACVLNFFAFDFYRIESQNYTSRDVFYLL